MTSNLTRTSVRLLVFSLLSISAVSAIAIRLNHRAAPVTAVANHTTKSDHSQNEKGGPWVIKSKAGTVTLAEFEDAYRRMNDKNPYATTLDSLKEFLTVYADYRLKLADAHKLGIDTDPKILDEIKTYRQMLAGPYLLDRELTDPAVKTLYSRRLEEVHAAHFLSMIHNPNDPADTLRAYNKAMEAIRRLNNGESMTLVTLNPGTRAILANGKTFSQEHQPGGVDTTWQGSDDKASARNGGDLGYFTGGQTVRAFEDEAYSLKPGEISRHPIRTRFGYHVIQVYDRVPRIGGVRVHHIFVQMPDLTIDTTSYYHKIDSLYRVVKAGANFEQVARESSEDKRSAADGGDMGYINHDDHRSPMPFDRAAYSLKDGEISGIVRTNLGYHIIKRVGTMPIKSFEQEREELKATYKKYYFPEDREKRLAALKKEYRLLIDSANVNYFITHVDSTHSSMDSAWSRKLTASDMRLPIYSLIGDKWTLGMLVDSLNAHPGSAFARNALYDMINQHIDENVLDLATRDISKKYPEFDRMMQEYKNGVIIFELENQRVWSQVVPDSAKELAYYNEHKARFLWPERVDVSEIFVTSDSLAKSLYKRIISGENFDTLAKLYTERPGFKDKAGHWGIQQKDENELARRAFTFVVGEVKEPFNFQGGYSIVKLNARDPIHEKTFAEARQEVASQYQDDRASELKANWVTDLRKKYHSTLNFEAVADAWNKNHSKTSSALQD